MLKKTKQLFLFLFSSYIQKVNDSLAIVQVELPTFSVFDIKANTVGLLTHQYNATLDYDSTTIGYGKCNLIKGKFHYFGIHLHKNQTPKEGDILKLALKLEDCYKGLLFTASIHHILFTTVDGREFYHWQAPFLWTKESEEQNFYNMMVTDIKYTGNEMYKQMPTENKIIDIGIYKGKKLFDVMQNCTVKELKVFLHYMKMRPKIYSGKTWKISELYATWIDGGAPTFVE
jgi:hypothetical protein